MQAPHRTRARRSIWIATLLAATTAGAREARAEGAASEADHRGLYLHLALGGNAGAVAGVSLFGGPSSMVGPAPSLSFQIGGFARPNLAVAFDLSATASPYLAGGGSSVAGAMGRGGVAVVYHFMPSNARLGLSLGFAAAGFNGGIEAGLGGGGELFGGKSWAVSPSWDVGVQGQFFYSLLMGSFGLSAWQALGGGVSVAFDYHGRSR
jgi:hypothetical protein